VVATVLGMYLHVPDFTDRRFTALCDEHWMNVHFQNFHMVVNMEEYSFPLAGKIPYYNCNPLFQLIPIQNFSLNNREEFRRKKPDFKATKAALMV